ncbi:MAG: RidA family protein [Pseudonocardia sediminis]
MITVLVVAGTGQRTKESSTMSSTYSRRIINPWSWQDDLGFVQGVEVTGGRTLYLAGAVASDEDGKFLHAGDIRGQVVAALDNAETILAAADMRWEHVVRFNWYVVSSVLDEFWEKGHPELRARFDRVGCRASGTLLGVDRLAEPELLCEFEGTAVAPVDA